MSRVRTERWRCDFCGVDGGIVDDNETLPPQWMVLTILIGVRQLDHEQRNPPKADACATCGRSILDQLQPKSDVAIRISGIIGRSR